MEGHIQHLRLRSQLRCNRVGGAMSLEGGNGNGRKKCWTVEIGTGFHEGIGTSKLLGNHIKLYNLFDNF